MDWMWGAGQVHIGFYLSGWRMGAVSEMRKTRRHTFNKDSSRTLCVSGAVTGLGEQDGMVPTIAGHTGNEALCVCVLGGGLPRSHSELEMGWSPEPLPEPPPGM